MLGAVAAAQLPAAAGAGAKQVPGSEQERVLEAYGLFSGPRKVGERQPVYCVPARTPSVGSVAAKVGKRWPARVGGAGGGGWWCVGGVWWWLVVGDGGGCRLVQLGDDCR